MGNFRIYRKNFRKIWLFCGILLVFMAGCQKEKKPENDGSLSNGGTTVPGGADETDPTAAASPEPTATAAPEPTKQMEEEGYFAGKSEKDFVKLAEDYADWLGNEKFDKVYPQLSETMQAQLDQDSLKTVWESAVLLKGDYKRIEKELTKTVLSNGFAVADVVLRFKEGGMIVRLTFNEALQIEGLFINDYTFEDEVTPTPAPVRDSRETEIKIGNGENDLDGILMLPEGIEQPPVVVLIQGSGQSDMDESIGAAGNKPFRDIAAGLADHGIATIRYNKRYYQYPELANETITIEDEVLLDAAEAIRFAKEDGRLDESRIFILGHSLGGMMAPKIAADHPEVTGLISLAGTPRGLEEVIYDQNIALLEDTQTLSEEERSELYAELQKMKEQAANVTEATLSKPVFGVSGYYWRSLNEIDQAALAKELTIPMLYLQGDADFQIYPETDFKLWQELLDGKENVSFRLYPGLSHLFMKSSGKKDVTEYDVPAVVESQVIDDIANWILTGKLLQEP